MTSMMCAMVLALMGTAPTNAPAPAPLRVGVTLHPYYSWVQNVVAGTHTTVVALVPDDVDAGDYQPRPEDIARLKDVDVVVANGIGHDDFVAPMIAAAGTTPVVVKLHNPSSLLPAAHGSGVNSHTFLSITMAIEQVGVIARELSLLRPADAATFARQALAYQQRLRALLSDARVRLQQRTVTPVLAVHDGYGYLLRELAIPLAGVVEPAHGLLPSAAELGAVVTRVRQQKLGLLLAEERFPPALAAPLIEAGCTTVLVTHIATGPMTPGRFEDDMRVNLDTLVNAFRLRTP
jgi:zinc transport system substrate-binding protein